MVEIVWALKGWKNMKKKKRLTLVIIILIIIGIVIIVSKVTSNKNEKTKRLLKIYDDLSASQTYLFEMKQNDKNKTIMAKKGNQTMIDQYSNGSHSTTLVKEDTTYLILHDRKEYYVYEQNNVDQSILIDGLEEVKDREFTTGEEKVKGKKYYYEEYNGSTMFMVSNSLEANEANIKTRFYFDKDDNLVYVKTINGDTEELMQINIENEVDDSIFEIPSDYAEN